MKGFTTSEIALYPKIVSLFQKKNSNRNTMKHFLEVLNETIKRDWELNALCNWRGEKFTFKGRKAEWVDLTTTTGTIKVLAYTGQ